MNFYEIYIFILAGLGIGLLSHTYGVGGGLITLPVLYLTYPQLPAHSIIGSCLLVVFITSATNTIINIFNKKNLNLNTLISFAIPQAMGCAVGSILAFQLSSSTLKTLIKILIPAILICLAGKLIKARPFGKTGLNFIFKKLSKSFRVQFGAFGAGVITGPTGLGGGVFLIPLLSSQAKLHRRDIPTYSNPIMMLSSLVAVIIYACAQAPPDIPVEVSPFQMGQINLALALNISLGIISGRCLWQRTHRQVFRPRH